MTGTLVNTAAVLAGGTLGSFIGAGLPLRLKETVITGISLTVIVLGVKMAIATGNFLIVLGSVSLGGIAGELLGIQKSLMTWLTGWRAGHRVSLSSPEEVSARVS